MSTWDLTDDTNQKNPTSQRTIKQQYTMAVLKTTTWTWTQLPSVSQNCQEEGQVFEEFPLRTDTALFMPQLNLINSFKLKTTLCVICTFYMAY